MKQRTLFMLAALLVALQGIAREFSYAYEGQTIFYTVIDEEAKTVQTRGTQSTNLPGNKVEGTLVLPAHPLDGDIEYTLTEIGGRGFQNCVNLKSIIIPSSVTSIGEYSFSGCTAMTSIEIPNSVTSIGEYSFSGCTALTSIEIPNSVTSIGEYSFLGCTALTSIEIPNSVTSIGDYAFSDCTSLRSIDIPNSVTSIGDYVFSGCVNLTSIHIPNSVICIGERTFSDCVGLTSVVLPNSVTSIGKNAFYNCQGLTTIEIPNSVTSIGEWAFDECKGLKSVEIHTPLKDTDFNPFVGTDNLESFYGEFVSEDNRCYIVDGVLRAFAPSNLAEYSIPNSVTSIGDGAFYGDEFLTSIEIPNSVTSIGDAAFVKSKCLTSINIPNSVTHIGSGAFSCCGSLTSIDIPNSVTSIGNGVFAWSSFTSINIPNSVTSIGKELFRGCWLLESISIPNSVTSIGASAFYDCSALTSIDIPNSVTSIGEYAFGGCKSLASVIIYNEYPTNVELGSNVFSRVDKSQCILYVPKGSVDLYRTADQWMDFSNIKEMQEEVQPRPFFGLKVNASDPQLRIMPYETKTITVDFDASEQVIGFQTDITLPEGLAIAETDGKLCIEFATAEAQASHSLSAAKVDGGKYRMIAFSESNSAFVKGNNFVNITVEAGAAYNGGDIEFTDIVASLQGNQTYKPLDCAVTLPSFVYVGELSVSPSECSVNRNSSVQLTATIAPNDAWVKDLAWASSNPEVATVDENGLVTAVSKGTARISASTTDGSELTAFSDITVTNYPTAIDLGENIVIVEHSSLQLNPNTTPEDADPIELEWSSSDPTVAFVDSDNILHALKVGEAEITANNEALGLSASVNVTVSSILYGDANDNGFVSIDDVVAEVQYILDQNPQPFNFEKADVNRDNSINVVDVTSTVTIILMNENLVANAPRGLRSEGNGLDCLVGEDVELGSDQMGTLVLRLQNIENVTAMQADIQLPNGISVVGVNLAEEQNTDHAVRYAELGDNRIRFVAYSLSSSLMTADMPLIEVRLNGAESFAGAYADVYEAYSSNTDCELSYFSPFQVMIKGADVSGIEEVSLDKQGAPIDIYSIDGIALKRSATQEDIKSLIPGLYIIGGKKVLIK